MTSFLNTLSRRERLMVMAAGGLLLLLVSYFAIISPLTKKLHFHQERIPAQQELLTWMEQSAQQVKKSRGLVRNTTRYSGSESASSYIKTTAKARGLGDGIKEVESTGQGIKVLIEGVIFDSIISWLDLLQQSYGLAVVDISISRAKDPGTVNVQVLFREGGHDES
ncbi:MAG: type II secretion system protein M [Desulfoarculaceae bacterium]|nr:type II secretion system protein M [Desulfoarculaceae bacterium]